MSLALAMLIGAASVPTIAAPPVVDTATASASMAGSLDFFDDSKSERLKRNRACLTLVK